MPIVRWRCRQWLYHIRAPCALLRASHTHISDSPALKPQSITNSLVQLRYEHSLTPRIDLWAWLGNAHVMTLKFGCLGTDVGATPHWDRPGSVMGWLPCLRPFPLTHTCRTPFPWDLAAAFKRLHKLVKSALVGLSSDVSHIDTSASSHLHSRQSLQQSPSPSVRAKWELYNSQKFVIFQ